MEYPYLTIHKAMTTQRICYSNDERPHLHRWGFFCIMEWERNTAFSFLAAKIAVCHATPARRPSGLVGRKKIILATLRYFFPPSLAGMRANGQQRQQEIKMPVSQAGMYNK